MLMSYLKQLSFNFRGLDDSLMISIRLCLHFIPNSRALTVEKVTSKELYWILITTTEHKPNSQKHFEKEFTDLTSD